MQVRSLKAKRFLGGPRGFPMEFFHRVPSPPRPQQCVAFDNFLQGSQHDGLAGGSGREAGRSRRTKTMTATRARKKISEFLRNPLRFPARYVAKANPPAAGLASQGLERKIVTGVLLRVKKHPPFGWDSWFIERPIFIAGFHRGVLLRRIGEKALDRFPGACACRSLIGPAASTYVQKAGLVRMNVGNDSRTNGNFWVVRARRQPLEITEQSRKPAFVTGFTPWLHKKRARHAQSTFQS